jgi:hypothetical protein
LASEEQEIGAPPLGKILSLQAESSGFSHFPQTVNLKIKLK